MELVVSVPNEDRTLIRRSSEFLIILIQLTNKKSPTPYRVGLFNDVYKLLAYAPTATRTKEVTVRPAETDFR